ncbi:hypothetical protein KSF_088420 [Reticulibacter mediterranei]|uniref:Tetratricopeptide repeat protein n=1 Tax=Reticulibacter mediterranei TaxID=2778369 RepID=A0A8J3IVU8_9CHLR|nr:tetratricopeptide repeat protein [Reticulibacter mediterranei]GHO98794.1 hypothetical protein KSF_088420 [Reticulibacter mediterranei]
MGATHPNTAGSLNNLAELYHIQKRYEETKPLLQRALTIIEAQLGADHPNTIGGLNNLAELYWEQGRYAEAEPLYQRAVAISLASLGSEHPQTQLLLKNSILLLADLHTNGDVEALLQLLAQHEQDNPQEDEPSP